MVRLIASDLYIVLFMTKNLQSRDRKSVRLANIFL
jgi:hypothetical protein